MAIKKRSATIVSGVSGAATTIKKTEASRNSFWASYRSMSCPVFRAWCRR